MLDCEECNVKLVTEETVYCNGKRLIEGVCTVCERYVYRVETVIEK